jgi:hypothetical protein
MAAGKEIRGKIKSVENTKKITKAMEMVAASKMRKAQERMRAARPYAEKVRNIAANLGKANPEYVHPFMRTERRQEGRRDRGDHRQGPVRRHEHQRAARRDHQAARAAGEGVPTERWPSATRAWVFSTASAPRWCRMSRSWATRRTWKS